MCSLIFPFAETSSFGIPSSLPADDSLAELTDLVANEDFTDGSPLSLKHRIALLNVRLDGNYQEALILLANRREIIKERDACQLQLDNLSVSTSRKRTHSARSPPAPPSLASPASSRPSLAPRLRASTSQPSMVASSSRQRFAGVELPPSGSTMKKAKQEKKF